ncbi:hypothetical protein DFH07DRAFT_742600 [Mycena maculata]|uniref:BZIP domain-containing protein n=1 Tax=Mycena maculata TaxID=230809 RepID=A0AAD7NDT8_9AGAR|nr:hypothetical protein DFH07DRAFT_742600 [Mycena maculata]
MLVESPLSQPSLFATSSSYGDRDYAQDINDLFNTELFTSAFSPSNNSNSQSSRESTPHILTPPQSTPAASFDIHDPTSPTPTFFNFLDEDVKSFDQLSMLSSAPYDFFGTFPSNDNTPNEMMGIDPQLVGSPAPLVFSDFDSDASTSPSSSSQSHASSPEEPVIAPVKVGGHGKARKGTVASGGISKKPSGPSSFKENNASTAFMPSTMFKPRSTQDEEHDDEDDLPADWRPPPEVYQKMSSKEKRQLRNKISARNFRVRRKEYISTLEDNIAERDRLLSAIRAELGSTQSENVALRQEIAALKKTLVEGRGPAPVLPPPAPLSPSLAGLASPTLSAVGSTSAASGSGSGRASPLPRVNTAKDVSATSARFWGGASGAVGGMGMGGYTSVHTTRIPELLGASPFAASPFAPEGPTASPQENLNPALNGGKVVEVMRSGLGLGAGTGAPTADAFGDANPFTVRSLDAYRMHLWGRMAAQYRHNKEHPTSNANAFTNPSPFTSAHAAGKAPLTGLAGGLRPKYFASPTLPYSASASSSTSANSLAASLAGLSLSGKHTPRVGLPAYSPSTSSSSSHGAAGGSGAGAPTAQESQRDRETAMYAALASQTLVKRLGGAFWDAFSGSERSSSSASNSHTWDAEKVRKVLEGTAVVRVVDVEPPKAPKKAPVQQQMREHCGFTRALEDSMRSLSLGKK